MPITGDDTQGYKVTVPDPVYGGYVELARGKRFTTLADAQRAEEFALRNRKLSLHDPASAYGKASERVWNIMGLAGFILGAGAYALLRVQFIRVWNVENVVGLVIGIPVAGLALGALTFFLTRYHVMGPILGALVAMIITRSISVTAFLTGAFIGFVAELVITLWIRSRIKKKQLS